MNFLFIKNNMKKKQLKMNKLLEKERKKMVRQTRARAPTFLCAKCLRQEDSHLGCKLNGEIVCMDCFQEEKEFRRECKVCKSPDGDIGDGYCQKCRNKQ